LFRRFDILRKILEKSDDSLLKLQGMLPLKVVEIQEKPTYARDSSHFQLLVSRSNEPAQGASRLIFAPPGVPVYASKDLGDYICILFDSTYLSSIDQVINMKKPVYIYPSPYSDRIILLILNFTQHRLDDERHFQLSCLITSLLSELNEQITASSILRTDQSISYSDVLLKGKAMIYATRYMRQNMHNPQLSLKDIAGSIGYNASYFCFEFGKIFSVSPIKYLNNVRLHHALRLLKNTDLPVKSICELVGFPNPSRLSSIVKQFSGVTPVKYRHSIKLQTINEEVNYVKRSFY
jgi:AraC-like DNA-binding protein